MSSKFRERIKGKEMKLFIYASAIILYVTAFLLASPKEIGNCDYIWISANYDPEYKDELDYLNEFLNKEKMPVWKISIGNW